MKCPFCGFAESKVIDSRPAEEGATIRRRRECLACQKRFTTYEIIETLPLVVIKRDGSRQSFDKSKLINGMVRACTLLVRITSAPAERSNTSSGAVRS